MGLNFEGRWFEKEMILQCVRWYVAYPLSYRQIEEIMAERGLEVDHSTINRWVLKYAPLLEKKFRQFKAPVGESWRMMRPISKSKVSGNTCTVPSTKMERRSTSFSRPIGTDKRHFDFSRKHWAPAERQRR